MPEGARVAMAIVGNAVRGKVLHELAKDGPLTTAQVAERIDAAYTVAARHLAKLEELGLVHASSHVTHVGRGPGRTWTIDSDRVAGIISDLGAYLLGLE